MEARLMDLKAGATAAVLVLGSTLVPVSPAISATLSGCLELARTETAPEVDRSLGRVLLQGQTREPVLLWRDGASGETWFRDCSHGQGIPTPVAELDQEAFGSALVARFFERRAEVPLYREVQSIGFAPEGRVEIEGKTAGSLVEARRLLDNEHVEITGSGEVQILPRAEVPVLLIASREVTAEAETEAWEEAWGEQPEDSQVEREIYWWEILGPDLVRVHPPVSGFAELSQVVARSDFSTAREHDLRDLPLGELRDRNVNAVLVVDGPDRVELAETVFGGLSADSSDAGLDVAILEDLKWSEDELARLEGTAVQGRLLRLVRYYDLAAILPDRLAGKIRRSYRAQIQLPTSLTGLVPKTYAVLGMEPSSFQVANGIFQDQAEGMARTVEFLGCLLDVEEVEDDARRKTLVDGFLRMGIAPERLLEMNVSQAFAYLFQGFSLPADMRAVERSFLRSVGRGDSEVSRLIYSLRDYFAAEPIPSVEPCDLALVPDAALRGGPFGETTVLAQRGTPEIAVEEAPLDAMGRIRQAKNLARLALQEAIYSKGAKHTKKKIRKGHQQLDEGDAFLLSGSGSERSLEKALKAFQKAEKIFLDAKEEAFRQEHEKPKIRVH